MNDVNLPHLSRRRFIAAAGLGATVAFVPRLVFAQKKGIVPTMIDDAARAKIETHRLRRGISVLEGSGGNIAVLTGKDGKLLIDSGFSVSKTRVAEALNAISLEHAQAAINGVVAEAKKRDWKMNVAVVDSGGNLVAFGRKDGAILASIQIAEHKARAAAISAAKPSSSRTLYRAMISDICSRWTESLRLAAAIH